ncbi:MAG: PEGA domain-containing protein [Deltaproteobacteria bacterium]|nr:PEGA domain-containing protein [Deltaproteobacteria bacterium]
MMSKRATLRCCFALALALVLGLATAARAGAGEREPDSGAMTEQARKLHVEGVEHFRNGDYDKARAAFTAAFAIKRHWQIAGALGACELKLGLYRDAAEHLHYFLEVFPESGDPAERKQTADLFEQARARVGMLRIGANVEGASVTLDGAALPAAGLDAVFVEPGKHAIEARKEGLTPARAAVVVSAGESRAVELRLGGAVPAAPPAAGGGPSWAVLGAGIGVTVVGVAAGAVLAAVANGKGADAEELDRQLDAKNDTAGSACSSPAAELAQLCADLDSAVRDKDTFTNAAAGTFVAAGVVALGTAAYGVIAALSAGNERHEQAVLVPVIAPGHQGFAFRAHF